VDNRGQNHVDRMCIYLTREIKTMPQEPKIETPSTQEERNAAKTDEAERIDRIADQAAGKAGRSEKQYDQGHDIFTK
jgi:hypothetical protein